MINLNCTIIQIFSGVPYYNTCLNLLSISCFFSRWEYLFLQHFVNSHQVQVLDSHSFSNFFSNEYPYWFRFFMDYHFGSSFSCIQSTFVAVSNIFLAYLSDLFFTNDKNPYPLSYFFAFVLQNNMSFLFINKQCQITFVFYFSGSTIFIFKFYCDVIKISVIGF